MSEIYCIEDAKGVSKDGWRDVRCDSMTVSSAGIVFFYEHTDSVDCGVSRNLIIAYHLAPGEAVIFKGYE